MASLLWAGARHVHRLFLHGAGTCPCVGRRGVLGDVHKIPLSSIVRDGRLFLHPHRLPINNIINGRLIAAPTVILILNLLIDKVYKENRLKGGKSKPAVLTELVLNGFPAASPHPPQSGGINL